MTVAEPQRNLSEPRLAGEGVTLTVPLIVNGMPVRPREKVQEKVNVWAFLGLSFVPDVLLFFALVSYGAYRLLRHLDARGMLIGRPDSPHNRPDNANV